MDPPLPVSDWSTPIAVNNTGTTWTVRAVAVGYTLSRVVTIEGHLVRIKDTIVTHGNSTMSAGFYPKPHVAIETTHRTAFVGGTGKMQGAVLPGTYADWVRLAPTIVPYLPRTRVCTQILEYPQACHSIEQEEATPSGDRTPITSSGNPTIHAHSSDGGAGMVPIDDVRSLY